MTYQELADWLRDCPEEHRECRYRHNTTISPYLYYNLESANKEAKGLLVRRNHGEWEEPLIEVQLINLNDFLMRKINLKEYFDTHYEKCVKKFDK